MANTVFLFETPVTSVKLGSVPEALQYLLDRERGTKLPSTPRDRGPSVFGKEGLPNWRQDVLGGTEHVTPVYLDGRWQWAVAATKQEAIEVATESERRWRVVLAPSVDRIAALQA